MRVPDVQYKSLEDAQSILQQAGLTVAVEYEKNNTVAKDHVIRQSLVAGSEVEPQTTITIYISKGNPNVNNNSTAVADNRGSRTTDRGTEGGKALRAVHQPERILPHGMHQPRPEDRVLRPHLQGNHQPGRPKLHRSRMIRKRKDKSSDIGRVITGGSKERIGKSRFKAG